MISSTVMKMAAMREQHMETFPEIVLEEIYKHAVSNAVSRQFF